MEEIIEIHLKGQLYLYMSEIIKKENYNIYYSDLIDDEYWNFAYIKNNKISLQETFCKSQYKIDKKIQN